MPKGSLTSTEAKDILDDVRIADPRALRAMAHPLRLDLIELLGTEGPSTAAVCARRLGSTQASCSYHLRQLAKYGYVHQADPRSDARERPWRLTDVEQVWSSSDDGAAVRELERVFVQREADRILGWQANSGEQPEAWRQVGFVGGATLPLTPDELADVRDQLYAVLLPYIARLTDRAARPAGHRFVRVMLAGTPAGAEPKEDLR